MADQTPRPLSRNDYTVGWISALAIESAAAAAMLDAEDPPLSVCPGDTNDYVLGRIGQHHVVMARISEAGGLPTHVVYLDWKNYTAAGVSLISSSYAI